MCSSDLISQGMHLPGDPCLPGIPFTPGIPSRPSVPSLPALINTISISRAIHTGSPVDTLGLPNKQVTCLTVYCV